MPTTNYRNPNQAERDKEYKARQAERGVVRKTVLVPSHRVPELHELMRKWRLENDLAS